ncbi:MAG: hypothetical protein NTW54_03175, partial [Bacteroidetes bacterium]|nr:hypothetical protein [Bacteroidota bacterium]
MCGFIGEYGRFLLGESDFNTLLDLSKKRGPDHQQTYKIDGQIQLGFNRLSIQDLSEHAHQPYHSPNQLFDFVFNGEIYNSDALISKFNLDKTKFRSTSDTEVIAHILETASIEALANELNGMFAIAIYDRNKKAVSLLRDFAGIKPLFYATHSEGMVFASQFNQVYKHKAIQKELSVNPEALKEYLALGYMQAPNTIYNSIYQVEPGTVLKYSLHDHQITKKDIVKYTY